MDRAGSYSSYILQLLKSRNSVIKSRETKKNNAEFQSVLIKLSNVHMYNRAAKVTAGFFPLNPEEFHPHQLISSTSCSNTVGSRFTTRLRSRYVLEYLVVNRIVVKRVLFTWFRLKYVHGANKLVK